MALALRLMADARGWLDVRATALGDRAHGVVVQFLARNQFIEVSVLLYRAARASSQPGEKRSVHLDQAEG